MSALSNRWGWLLGIAFAFSGNCALAQITPDGTLPNNSDIRLQGNTFNITGGTQAGSNLFHSFGQFSVPTGGTAFFNNAVDIQNIISRVTGGSVSNIDGLIRANGTANLFLINPSGIVFGQNASLNVGGSFVASTASTLKFADNFEFSAAPQSTPLLTISVPVGLQFGVNPGSILSQSQATNSSRVPVGLQVQPGKTLALVGGEVKLDGGILQVPGGRVELGGLVEPGTVGLNGDSGNLSLNFPDGVVRGDVSLTNGADVFVRADNGGDIAINARNLEITKGVDVGLRAGIADGLGNTNSKAGNIDINAQGTVNLQDGGVVSNAVRPKATGQAGNINIKAGSVSVGNGFQIVSRTDGKGDAGNVIINAQSVSFDGKDKDGIFSGILSNVTPSALGKGGDISISANSLSVTNGAGLSASTSGQGDAGNVIINARDTVSFDGISSDGMFRSAILSSVEQTGVGNGGDIRISTGSLSVTNGAQLSTSTNGQGDAGNVIINAKELVTFDSTGAAFFFGSRNAALSSVEQTGVGNGGDIRISTGSLSVIGSRLSASTNGKGDAGSIIINARDGIFFNGGEVSSDVGLRAIGKGGDIRITTGSLSVTKVARLDARTFGQGDAGSIIIDARDVSFNRSDATSDVGFNAVGKGGDIYITTNRPVLKLASQYLQGFETNPCRFSLNVTIRV